MIRTVESVDDDVVTLEDGSTQVVDANAKVTLNGKPVKLADLKNGDSVTFTGNPATAVAATR